jgi:hypothetical protein
MGALVADVVNSRDSQLDEKKSLGGRQIGSEKERDTTTGEWPQPVSACGEWQVAAFRRSGSPIAP